MNEEKNNLEDEYNKESYWDRPFEGISDDAKKEKEEVQEKDVGEKPKKVDIKKYKNVEGAELWKLKVGLWYVEHKAFLRTILISFLILISAVSWAYTIYGFAYYLTRGLDEDRLLAASSARSGFISHNAILSSVARDLEISQIQAINVNNRLDVFVEVNNPNLRHGASFDYYFLVGEEKTKMENGFILPGESKYLLSLSNELSTKSTSVQLVFDSFVWKRIDRHEIPDWSVYRDGRIDIEVKNDKFISAQQSGLSDEINLNTLEFLTINNSIYNYWNVGYVILLYSGSSIVGVNRYGIDEFMSEQEREVVISWPGNISRVSRVEILPEINILRDDIYIKYDGNIGEEK